MDERRRQLRELAAQQDGQFATAQATRLGLTESALRSLCDIGEILRLRRGVWRFRAAAGAPDPAVCALLACWPSAVISHRSAAMFHGLVRAGWPVEPEVTVPFGARRRQAGITVHTSRSLRPGDVLSRGAVRYTSLARTVCDLAEGQDASATLAFLDDAIALGAQRRWIHQRASELAAGRGGVALIVRATAPGGDSTFRSWLERAAAEVYRQARLPSPEWNVPVHDQRGLIGVVDALWTPWCVVSEKEGLRFHTTPLVRRRDAARFNRLANAAYVVRRFTWEDIVRTPVEVAETVARALRSAGCEVDFAEIPREIRVPALRC